MKKIVSALLVAMMLLSISGCTSNTDEESNNVIIDELNTADLEGDFFYDVFSQSICAWSHDTILQKKEWEKADFKSVMVYYFDDLTSDLFTIGDSYMGMFCIAKHKYGNYLQPVYSSVDKVQSIVPIGHNEETSLFSVVDESISEQGLIKYEILEYKADNTIEIHKWFRGPSPPLSGVFLNKWFYFTVYNYESELYDLYKWRYEDEKSNAILVDSELDDMKVFLENEKVIYSKKNLFEFSNCKIPMTTDTKLFQFRDKLLQFVDIDQNSRCIIHNLHDGEAKTIKDAIGVSTIGSSLFIYTINGSRIEVQ